MDCQKHGALTIMANDTFEPDWWEDMMIPIESKDVKYPDKPNEIDSLPRRKKRCETCNYRVFPHMTVEKNKEIHLLNNICPHRCHSAWGSVCAGSLMAGDDELLAREHEREMIMVELGKSSICGRKGF